MNRLLRDGWFQMFAAVAGLAMIVSVVGSVTARHAPAAPAAAAVPAPAPTAAPVAAAPAPVVADPPAGKITPAPVGSSSDLARYSGASSSRYAPPAAAVAPPPPPPPAANAGPAPKMTLTGAGVGNAQGITPSAPGTGGLTGFLSSILGTARAPAPAAAPYAAAPFGAPPQLVTPAKPGVYKVDAAGGGDTTSLRDAAYSAASGDLILVQPGVYAGPVEVTGKKLAIRGTGAGADAVTVNHAGRGAAVMVRDGELDLAKVRVLYGSTVEYPPQEPHGALYAIASTVRLRGVELGSGAWNAPPLIVEQGGKPTRISFDGGQLMGGQANAIIRGGAKISFKRVRFDHANLPVVAWIDAAIDFTDCAFNGVGKPAVNVYEGATAVVTMGPTVRIDATRGSDATTLEQAFGPSRAALARGGFSRDIFRRGRKPGTIP